MGTQAFDQYSLLHFASGVVAYFFHVPLWLWFIINIIFEVFENSMFGINLIQQVSIWPGGKSQADIPINSVCDIIFCMIGWGVSYFVDYLGHKYKWYKM